MLLLLLLLLLLTTLNTNLLSIPANDATYLLVDQLIYFIMGGNSNEIVIPANSL